MPQYIEHETLREWILSNNNEFIVVDVRGDDYETGNIPGALNVPSDQFKEKCVGLVEKLKVKRNIVFHCALSQVRGPTCAKYYESYLHLTGNDGSNSQDCQNILVLRNGFNGWQLKFRNDERLVENLNEFYYDNECF